MRNPVAFLLLTLALAGPAVAQAPAPRPHPEVPAALDVAGLHLVLNDEARRLVQQKADGLRRHQPSFQARVDLADAAFPIIDRVLQEEGVPLDFRYLALQESALQGNARSSHDAVGYWQLKQETATSLGLAVNAAVDERQHLTASTRAAARYLARNNAGLHNWLNALLSYNTGLGGVKPYILPADADATQVTITETTAPYVLMFLAQKLAFEPACGLNPRPPLRLQEFPAVAGQTLAAQALILHVDSANLVAHNRWLLAPAVPADRPYTLIVPVGDITQAAGIVANQRLQSRAELLNLPAVAANTAEVRLNDLRALVALPGETTADLARRGHEKLGEFLHHNELSGFDVAVVGRPYYLESKRDVAAVEYHVLLPGETIFDVAQKYGVRQKAILSKNRMARNEELRPGRVLWLQHTRPREVAVEYRTLPDGVALERIAGETALVAASLVTDASAKSQRPNHDSEEGWGDALPASNSTAAPVSVAAPAAVAVSGAAVATAPAVPVATLPLPAPAPAPAPLADEPTRPAPVASPVVVAGRSDVAPAASSAPVVSAPKVAVNPAVAAPASTTVAPATSTAATTHRVAAGETLYAIGRRYQLAPAALMAWNNLTPPAGLVVGQVLVLQAPSPAPTAAPMAAPAQPGSPNPAFYVPKAAPSAVNAAPATPAGTAAQHTVAKGETLYGIARLYNVKVAELKAWNAKTDETAKVGEMLFVKPR